MASLGEWHDEQAALASGVDDLLYQPVDRTTLMAAVERQLPR